MTAALPRARRLRTAMPMLELPLAWPVIVAGRMARERKQRSKHAQAARWGRLTIQGTKIERFGIQSLQVVEGPLATLMSGAILKNLRAAILIVTRIEPGGNGNRTRSARCVTSFCYGSRGVRFAGQPQSFTLSTTLGLLRLQGRDAQIRWPLRGQEPRRDANGRARGWSRIPQ